MARIMKTFGQMPVAPYYVMGSDNLHTDVTKDPMNVIVLPCCSRDEAKQVAALVRELLKLSDVACVHLDQLEQLTLAEHSARERADRLGMDWRAGPIRWTLMTRADAPKLYPPEGGWN